MEAEWCVMLSSDLPDRMAGLTTLVNDVIDSNDDCSIRMGLGDIYFNLNETWAFELESILSLLTHRKEIRVCEYQNSKLPGDTGTTFGSDDFHQLWLCYAQKDQVGINKWLAHSFPGGITDQELRLRCLQGAHSILSHLRETDTEANTYFVIKRLQYLVRMFAHHSSAELVQWIRETFRHKMESLFKDNEKKNDQIIAWCQSYIMNNLDNNLSLSKLSEQVHFSPSHLSNLFKQVTGQNYIEFVTGLKITQAKKELRESNRKIHDIACSLGYEDARYFSKLFQRELGMTPSEYKFKIAKEQTIWTDS
jgi:AraC-like DNA-binding protein